MKINKTVIRTKSNHGCMHRHMRRLCGAKNQSPSNVPIIGSTPSAFQATVHIIIPLYACSLNFRGPEEVACCHRFLICCHSDVSHVSSPLTTRCIHKFQFDCVSRKIFNYCIISANFPLVFSTSIRMIRCRHCRFESHRWQLCL